MSNDEKAIELAAAAKAFKETELWRHISSEAEAIIAENKVRLVDVDPEDTKQVRTLQEEIRRQSNLGFHLDMIIFLGEQAKQATAEEY